MQFAKEIYNMYKVVSYFYDPEARSSIKISYKSVHPPSETHLSALSVRSSLFTAVSVCQDLLRDHSEFMTWGWRYGSHLWWAVRVKTSTSPQSHTF